MKPKRHLRVVEEGEHVHAYGEPYPSLVGRQHVTRRDCACGAYEVSHEHGAAPTEQWAVLGGETLYATRTTRDEAYDVLRRDHDLIDKFGPARVEQRVIALTEPDGDDTAGTPDHNRRV